MYSKRKKPGKSTADAVVASKLRTLYTVNFIDVIGFAMAMPPLTFFALQTLKLDALRFGLIMSAHAFVQAISGASWGYISDRWSRRLVLCILTLWSGLCMCTVTLVNSFEAFLGMKAVSGISGGANAITQSYVLDTTPKPSVRSEALGALSASTGLAFVTGPAIAAALSYFKSVPRPTLIICGGCLQICASIFCFFYLKERGAKTADAAKETTASETGSVASVPASAVPLEIDQKESPRIGFVDSKTPIYLLWWSRLFSSFTLLSFFSVYPFVLRDLLHMGDEGLGIMVSYGAAVQCITQIMFFSKIERILGRHATLAMTLIGLSLCMSTCFYMTTAFGFAGHVVWKTLHHIFIAILEPAIPSALAAHIQSTKDSGATLGMSASFRSLAAVVAPSVTGALYHHYGTVAAFSIGALSSVLAAGLVVCAKYVSSSLKSGESLFGGVPVYERILSEQYPASVASESVPLKPIRSIRERKGMRKDILEALGFTSDGSTRDASDCSGAENGVENSPFANEEASSLVSKGSRSRSQTPYLHVDDPLERE